MKDKIFSKLNIKNYNNQLEEILENKNYSENAKNVLLTILYKVENTYPEYIKLKGRVISKDEYICNLFNIIQNKCNEITIVKNIVDDIKSVYKNIKIDLNNKRIESYQIDKVMLYCLATIDNKDVKVANKYEDIKKAFCEFVQDAYIENTVEIVRDFNVWSWEISRKEIFNYMQNIVVQNISMLITQERLYKILLNSNKKDFLIEINEEIAKRYGKEFSDVFIQTLISFIIQTYLSKNKKNVMNIESKILKYKNDEEENKKEEKNRIKLENEKIKLTKKIKKLDKMLKSKELLKAEYIKYNKRLIKNNKEKISSQKFVEKIKRERNHYRVQLKKNLKLQNINTDVELNNEILRQEKINFLESLRLDNPKDLMLENFMNLQKLFMKVIEGEILKFESNKALFYLIKKIRYYCLLPINLKDNMDKIKTFSMQLEKIKLKMIEKSIDKKLIIRITKDKKLNYEILKHIFEMKSLELENIFIQIVKDREGNLKVNFFDKDTLENTKTFENVDFKNILIRYNKNIKIFSNIK